MASLLLTADACSERRVLLNTRVMIHQLPGNTSGQSI
jgi:ATP-dependent protease ClpP protease subunit